MKLHISVEKKSRFEYEELNHSFNFIFKYLISIQNWG